MEEIKNLQNDRDWMLFELLEGNLEPADAEALRARIEKDAELRAEWELMSETVLQDPPISYPDKSRYHKKDKAKILFPVFTSGAFRIAASFTGLFILGYFLISTFREAPVTATLDPIQTEKPVAPGELQEIMSEKTSEENVIEDMLSDPAGGPFSDIKAEIPSQKVYADVFPSEETGNERLVPTEGAPNHEKFALISARPIRHTEFGNPLHSIELPDHLQVIFNLDPWNSRYYVIEDQTASSLPGLRGMLDQGLALLAQPIRNTHVHLTRDSETQKPTLKITYEGVHYQALAMLELKLPESISTKQ